MEQLKTIKEQLIAQVQSQMGDLKCVDAKELGEVVDMIKDLSEAVYYCEVYEQMKEAGEARKQEEPYKENNYYYTERYYPTYDHQRDADRDWGKMYYSSPSSNMGSSQGQTTSSQNANTSSSRSYYTERDYPIHIRDEREGKSPITRKMYMESKSMGYNSSKSIQELENYMKDLTSDMMDMLAKASPEEKEMVQKKINTLAAKVQNV